MLHTVKIVSAKAIAALPARFAALERFLGGLGWFMDINIR